MKQIASATYREPHREKGRVQIETSDGRRLPIPAIDPTLDYAIEILGRETLQYIQNQCADPANRHKRFVVAVLEKSDLEKLGETAR